MKPFLKQVAERYFLNTELSKLCFIFPNKRSSAFFVKYITEVVANKEMNARAFGHKGEVKPIVMPRICSINDFFYSLSGKKETDRVTLILNLYDSYKKALPKDALPDTLDEFIYWGDVLLSDFNDVDKYLVNPESLFTNIAEFRDLDTGLGDLEPAQKEALSRLISHFKEKDGLSFKKGGKVKENFLKLWNMLYPIYSDFNSRLEAQGLSYEGMAYRCLAEKIIEKPAVDLLAEGFKGIEKFVFIGLNALNECEKTVMKKMRDAGIAEFCWDFSSSMIKDRDNQSSKFMRDRKGSGNIDMFPQAFELDKEGLELPKIKAVSVPSSVGQVSQIPRILKEIGGGELYGAGRLDIEGKDCAIVIPDETLLLPLLNAVPEEIEDINVTMGYPLSDSSIFFLLRQVSVLQLNMRKLPDGSRSFYHKQVRALFSNEIFRRAAGEAGVERMKAIRKEGKYYIPQSDFAGIPLFEKVFVPVVTDLKSASSEQILAFGNYQADVIKAIASAVSSNPNMAMEAEFSRKCFRSINLLMKKPLEILPSTYIKLVERMLSGVSVPFNGEPLKGLQIMGPLETRALDFTNIIILSANEGVFPGKNVASSFIPPEIRKGFGLPTYEYQDRVWAYYFYRMIQRAYNVWLIFDSRQEGLKSGEESRYIKQLEYIYSKKYGLSLERFVAEANAADKKTSCIDKTEEDVEFIKNKELSATVIEKYLSCPAQFYYSVVKELSAEEDVAESIDGGMAGNIFHSIMEALYTGEKAMEPDFDLDLPENKKKLAPLEKIDRSYIQTWLGRKEKIEEKVKALIKKTMGVYEIGGRDLITMNLIVSYVLNTLKKDFEFLKESGQSCFMIHGLELKKKWEFKGFKFKGFIDRLDSVGGDFRVVDYKTGRVLDKEKDINEANAEQVVQALFSPDTPSKDRPKIAFQLFLYDKLMEKESEASGKPLVNSIYHVASLFKEPVKNVPVCKTFMEMMEENLEALLNEISSTQTGFRLTEDKDVCKYCEFNNICGR